MIYICLELIKPTDLDHSSQTFDSSSFKGIKLTNVLRSFSGQENNSNETIKDKNSCLEKLTSLCQYGDKYCKRIKLDFRLTNEVFKNYLKK